MYSYLTNTQQLVAIKLARTPENQKIGIVLNSLEKIEDKIEELELEFDLGTVDGVQYSMVVNNLDNIFITSYDIDAGIECRIDLDTLYINHGGI